MCRNLRLFFLIFSLTLTLFSGEIHAATASTNQLPNPDIHQTTSNAVMSLPVDANQLSAGQTSAEPVRTENVITSNGRYIQNDELTNSMLQDKWLFVAGEFWLLGLLLAFTPCTLPLLLIIAGFLGHEQGKIPQHRTLLLSITYVLALASTYAIAGVVTASFGIYLQAYFQNRWVIIIFSVVIALLALSLLGFYKIKLPATLQHFVVRHNKLQSSYRHIQVAIMGVLATLIASPCLAAPLVTILGYIGATGSVVLGAFALFFVGIGIGTPLLVATTVGKEFLPHDAKWQPVLKVFFGLALLGVAIWTLSRVVPSQWNMMFWSILVVYTANYMFTLHITHFRRFSILWKSLCMMMLVYGVAIFVGGMMGNTNPANPLSMASLQPSTSVTFNQVDNLAEFDNALANAKNTGKPVVVMFTAEWCQSCKIFKDTVLTDAQVKSQLSQFVLLEVNLTHTNTPPYIIAGKYHVIGAPEVIFFNSSGVLSKDRIAGETNVAIFEQTLKNVIKE